jgi:hypothetical protein
MNITIRVKEHLMQCHARSVGDDVAFLVEQRKLAEGQGG